MSNITEHFSFIILWYRIDYIELLCGQEIWYSHVHVNALFSCNNYNYLLLYQRTWAENGLFLCKCPTPCPRLFNILFKRKPTLMIITSANTMCWWAVLRVEIIDTTNMGRCDGHNALSGLERQLESSSRIWRFSSPHLPIHLAAAYFISYWSLSHSIRYLIDAM